MRLILNHGVVRMFDQEFRRALRAALMSWASADSHGCRTGGSSDHGFDFLQLHHASGPHEPDQHLTIRASLVDGRPVVMIDLPQLVTDRATDAATRAATQTVSLGGSVDEPPLRDPDATCEGCHAVGTVGCAVRFDTQQVPVELHRFCAACWPEHSARYRARWDEEVRLARASTRRDDGHAPSSPPTSTMIGAATWHGPLELVQQLQQALIPTVPPTRADLARVAAELARVAPTLEGEMPLEVAAFIDRYGGAAAERRI